MHVRAHVCAQAQERAYGSSDVRTVSSGLRARTAESAGPARQQSKERIGNQSGRSGALTGEVREP